MTETRIYRPKGSIYFQSYTDSELVNMPKDWRPSISDYAEVLPDCLYLVTPDGVVLEYKTETAVRYGVLSLPDLKVDFTEDSSCVKTLSRIGKYRVWIHERPCYVYTPSKYKQLLQQAGRKSLAKQLAYIKSKLNEVQSKKKLAETLIEKFSKGL